MGALDGFLTMMKGRNDDYDDYDDYEDEPQPRKSPRKAEAPADEYAEEPKKSQKTAPKPMPKIGALGGAKKGNGNNRDMEVCVCKPTSFDDAPKISDCLKEGSSVVLNLEGIDMDLARRIFDFATGACYALEGRIEPISKFVYVLTPEAIYIVGDTNEEEAQGALGRGFIN